MLHTITQRVVSKCNNTLNEHQQTNVCVYIIDTRKLSYTPRVEVFVFLNN